MESEVVKGYGIYQLHISSLPQGMYFVSWIEDSVVKGQAKLIRAR